MISFNRAKDLYKINPHYGTTEELKALVKECHKHDVCTMTMGYLLISHCRSGSCSMVSTLPSIRVPSHPLYVTHSLLNPLNDDQSLRTTWETLLMSLANSIHSIPPATTTNTASFETTIINVKWNTVALVGCSTKRK